MSNCQGDHPRISLPRDECVYTSCYCEENVWHLCDFVQKNHPEEIGNVYAVFISNNAKQVPLFMQRAAREPHLPVFWDYHVILIHTHPSGNRVYDLDSVLPFPVSFQDYIIATVGSNDEFPQRYLRLFRVIPAELYLETLASDRSHMKEDGQWCATPPSYPCIVAKDGTTMNLKSFISMKKGTGHGEVMTLEELGSEFMAEKT